MAGESSKVKVRLLPVRDHKDIGCRWSRERIKLTDSYTTKVTSGSWQPWLNSQCVAVRTGFLSFIGGCD